jgi:AraC-like DNA-binding protein
MAAKVGSHGFTIADVARSLQISESYIRQLFAEAGTTFTDFVLAERLASILTNRCTETAASARSPMMQGFGDVSYFNRTFRRSFGATPSDVREAAQRPK